jgi:DNA-binding SARP family transcriptional activator
VCDDHVVREGMTELDPGVEFRALGPLELLVAGRIVGLGSAKLRLTLAALLLHANEVVSADRLVDILWGDEPPETAIGTVQSLVYRLRRLLTPADGAARGDDILVTRAPGYLLRV